MGRRTAVVALLALGGCGTGGGGDDTAEGADEPRCDATEPEVCYGGAPGTAGRGDCTLGLRHCRDGVWSTCEGEVTPVAEVCNGRDDDCDGRVDEDAPAPCADCGPDCESIDFGPGGTAFDPGPSSSSGVIATPEGFLTLSGDAAGALVIWIANSLDGTVSKFDSRSRVELARYRTGPLGASSGLWAGDGENPSRTSVDYDGDAFVANRAFTAVPSVTKILADDCPDRGDGVVDSSTGPLDVYDWDAAGPADDCIAWHTEIGTVGSLCRAVATQLRAELDGAVHEYVWAGVFREERYYEIDGETGERTGVEVDVGCTPYGAAIDADGNLWSASYGGVIARFDTDDVADKELVPLPRGESSYGITVDAAGNVWSSSVGIDRYRPADRQWDTVVTNLFTAGIAADADGIVWANGDAGDVVRIDSNDPALPFTVLRTGRGGRGVAIDFDGFVWVIHWARPDSDGDVTVIDPADPEELGTVCCESINNSYTYSDMSGFQLRNATGPRGTYELLVQGCPDAGPTEWADLTFEGTFPPGTRLRVDVRTAATLAALAHAPWIALAVHPPDESPVDVGAALDEAAVDPAPFLGVRITLESPGRDAAPVLERIAVQRICAPSLE